MAMVERRDGRRVTQLSLQQTCPNSVPVNTARVLLHQRDLVAVGQRANQNVSGRVEDKR